MIKKINTILVSVNTAMLITALIVLAYKGLSHL